MTCNECFEAVSSALDGELEPNDQQAMDEHLEECAHCRHLRSRILALSQDIKNQTFPHPTPDQLQTLTRQALAGAQASKFGWLRGWLRRPYENWPLRVGLRFVTSGSLTVLVFLSLLLSYILPAYQGAEAVPKSALPQAVGWLEWLPSAELVFLNAALVLVFGLWTAGLPGLLLDLVSESTLSVKDIVRLGISSVLLAPLAGLPFLLGLEPSAYIVLGCLWAAFSLIVSYFFVAFKAERSLPKLALDFALLAVVVGILEATARWSQGLPGRQQLLTKIAALVGSADFATLSQCILWSLLGFTIPLVGLICLVPSYRSQGGRTAGVIIFLLGLGCFGFSLSSWRTLPLGVPVRAEYVGAREAFILGSGQDDPWLLTHLPYPRLDVNVVGPSSSPKAARLRIASAYLDWNEKALLESLTQWAANAPGVAWGLSSFTDNLGQRQQSTMVVPTQARKQAVETMLSELRWRMLDEVVLSQETGTLSGQLMGQADVAIRLIEVPESGSVQEAVDSLNFEQALVEELAERDPLSPHFQFPSQRTTLTEMDGRFQFQHLSAGRYFLAILKDEPVALTLNPTIPGMIELSDGQQLELPPIQLTSGVAGQDISLAEKDWQAEGVVDFSANSDLTTAKLTPGSSISGFVDSTLFSGGKARLKILAEPSEAGQAHLLVRFLAKNGRELNTWRLPLSGLSVYNELIIDTDGLLGYLQLSFVSQKGQLTVKKIKLEMLRDG